MNNDNYFFNRMQKYTTLLKYEIDFNDELNKIFFCHQFDNFFKYSSSNISNSLIFSFRTYTNLFSNAKKKV